MPRATLERLRELLPKTRPFLMYGLTEAFRGTYLPPEQVDLRPDSMGKAIPNADILVVRPDGSACDADEPGELVQRGALVALGYWNDPAKTAERFKPLPGQRAELPIAEMAVWSGDTVRRDAEGYLYFVGRRDEMIKTSGYRVSPTEVEEIAYASGLVGDAVAVGRPAPGARRGHRARVLGTGLRDGGRRARCRPARPLQGADAGLHGAAAHRVARGAAAQSQRQVRPACAGRPLQDRVRGQPMTVEFPQHVPSPYYEVDGDCLLVGGRRLTELVAEIGHTPFYVYDRAVMDRRVQELRAALPAGLKLHYAIKANPMPAVVEHLARQVDGLDVASGRELEVALTTGTPRHEISFAGPGKTDSELEAAARAGIVVNLESEGEMRRLARIGTRLGLRPAVAMRVNPDFELKTSGMKMSGGPKQFGIDAELVPAVLAELHALPLEFVGLPHLQRLAEPARRGAHRGAGQDRGACAATRRPCAGPRAHAQPRRRFRHPLFSGRAAARPRRRSARTSPGLSHGSARRCRRRSP